MSVRRIWAGRRFRAIALSVVASALALPGCSSDNDQSAGTPDGAAGSAGGGAEAAGGLCGSPVPATEMDMHCEGDAGPIKQEANSCPDAASADDGGAEEDYPEAHNGTSAADDDCKYDVTYSATCSGGATTFKVTLKSRVTGMGLAGADPQIEASMPAHPLPNGVVPMTTDDGNGNYTISGVAFDQSGTWTVRFHFFETCLDSEETSMHGHAAFLVNVP